MDPGCDVSELFQFEPMLPESVTIVAPTAYSKLNLLNLCVQTRVFGLPGERCAHRDVAEAKKEIIKQIISRIVQADAVAGVIPKP